LNLITTIIICRIVAFSEKMNAETSAAAWVKESRCVCVHEVAFSNTQPQICDRGNSVVKISTLPLRSPKCRGIFSSAFFILWKKIFSKKKIFRQSRIWPLATTLPQVRYWIRDLYVERIPRMQLVCNAVDDVICLAFWLKCPYSAMHIRHTDQLIITQWHKKSEIKTTIAMKIDNNNKKVKCTVRKINNARMTNLFFKRHQSTFMQKRIWQFALEKNDRHSILSNNNCVSQNKSLQYIIKSCFSKVFQTRSDDVIAECMNMFNCLPVADAISRCKKIFCHGSASVITFYVISAVLLYQLSSDYGHYITF